MVSSKYIIATKALKVYCAGGAIWVIPIYIASTDAIIIARSDHIGRPNALDIAGIMEIKCTALLSQEMDGSRTRNCPVQV